MLSPRDPIPYLARIHRLFLSTVLGPMDRAGVGLWLVFKIKGTPYTCHRTRCVGWLLTPPTSSASSKASRDRSSLSDTRMEELSSPTLRQETRTLRLSCSLTRS